jgi:hypothetical protein
MEAIQEAVIYMPLPDLTGYGVGDKCRLNVCRKPDWLLLVLTWFRGCITRFVRLVTRIGWRQWDDLRCH